MHIARIIVSEKTGYWTAVLRRAMSSTGYRIHETRSTAECWRELEQNPASLVALELTPDNCESVAGCLVELSSRFHQARAIVLGPRGMEPYEWMLREAGAAHVLFSPRYADGVARLIERHMAQAPQHQPTFHDSIRARLPWGGS
jgi:ActR/RegA family two-component response regulator